MNEIIVDISGLKELQKQFEKLSGSEINEFIEDTTRKLSIELLSKTIDDTPYVTSNLRRHWTNHAEGYVSSAPSPEEYVNAHEITKSSNTYVFQIYNNCEYAPYIEWGHRSRDGKGWVNGYFPLTMNVARLNKNAGKRIEGYFNKFLNSKFK